MTEDDVEDWRSKLDFRDGGCPEMWEEAFKQRQERRETCFCAGEHPEWDYHHPTGCGDTAQAFAYVAEVRPHEAWDEPRG